MSNPSARSDCEEDSRSENGSGKRKAGPASSEDAAQSAAMCPERHSGEIQSYVPVCFGLALPDGPERNCVVGGAASGRLSVLVLVHVLVPAPVPVQTPGCSTS